jgi:hypothetical protein
MNLLTVLIIYIDNIMLLGNSLDQIKEVKKLLSRSVILAKSLISWVYMSFVIDHNALST